MITNKFIKEAVMKQDKKISIKAFKKLNNYLEKEINKKIFHASRNADFSGRKIIKEEDFE